MTTTNAHPPASHPTVTGRFVATLGSAIPRRFMKFCTVGASGVVVNMATLALLAEIVAVNDNLASALAIAVSILSNFLLNDVWTFRDRRAAARAFWRRLVRFFVVSLLGAVIQWTVFVLGNFAIFSLTIPADVVAAHWDLSAGTSIGDVVAIVSRPPPVGAWKYLSQLCGIALATGWNFLANVYWTWASIEQDVDDPVTRRPG
jgi:putative flippase GtrA